MRQCAAGLPTRRLAQIMLLDPEPMTSHAKVVWRDGRRVGYLRSASYGHTRGGAVGLAMNETDEPVGGSWFAAGQWQVEIAGRRHPAGASLRPLVEPVRSRILA